MMAITPDDKNVKSFFPEAEVKNNIHHATRSSFVKRRE